MNTKYTELAVKTAIGVLGLLVLFLATKTITEVISWSKDTIYPTKTITITADGEALAVADIASFTFSVDEEGATSEEAKDKSAEKINKALEYLKTNGVKEEDIKNENYSIYPKYNNSVPCYTFNCPVAEQKIIGYTASQSIRVKVRETDNAGKFLSELTKFGINNISGISFTIDDEEVLYDQARKDAVTKAQAKAEVLAKDLGVRLGDVISFNEDSSDMYPPAYGMESAAMDASFSKTAVPQIPAGENKYTSRVYVTYELK
jgi:uncharacterized protein YggE